MAQSQSNWSKETYRFDEIAGKFKLPLLVQVSEGFYRGNEVDSFSAGDIIMFEQFVTLQKVAAVFARPLPQTERGCAVPEEEILIPLNYNGKLRVEHEIKAYECVQELAKDFPRYATVLETIAAPASGGGVMDIEAGTDVELDRVIPPRLVINTRNKQVGLNLEERYKFRSKLDSNVYTLREAVNRYSLPQIVSFLDNKIHSIYVQDLIEGVEEMANVTTSALQLRRVVQQKVLIGHYKKPIQLDQESGRNSQTHCNRTLVVVPLDSSDMREILVNIYTGDVSLSNYETMLVKDELANTRRSIAMAEGLYTEFFKKPRLIRLPEIEDWQETETEDEAPPLLPRRPTMPDISTELCMANMTLREPQMEPRLNLNKNEDIRPLPKDSVDENIDDPFLLEKEKTGASGRLHRSKSFKNKEKEMDNTKKDTSTPTGKKHTENETRTVLPTADQRGNKTACSTPEGGVRHYDDPYEWIKDGRLCVSSNESHNTQASRKTQANEYTRQTKGKSKTAKKYDSYVDMTGIIRPTGKEFHLLSKTELKDRLNTCGMEDFAEFCFKQKLDGFFLVKMNDETLQSLELTPFEKNKLKEIITGWIPT